MGMQVHARSAAASAHGASAASALGGQSFLARQRNSMTRADFWLLSLSVRVCVFSCVFVGKRNNTSLIIIILMFTWYDKASHSLTLTHSLSHFPHTHTHTRRLWHHSLPLLLLLLPSRTMRLQAVSVNPAVPFQSSRSIHHESSSTAHLAHQTSVDSPDSTNRHTERQRMWHTYRERKSAWGASYVTPTHKHDNMEIFGAVERAGQSPPIRQTLNQLGCTLHIAIIKINIIKY